MTVAIPKSTISLPPSVNKFLYEGIILTEMELSQTVVSIYLLFDFLKGYYSKEPRGFS